MTKQATPFDAPVRTLTVRFKARVVDGSREDRENGIVELAFDGMSDDYVDMRAVHDAIRAVLPPGRVGDHLAADHTDAVLRDLLGIEVTKAIVVE